jgi:DNA-binding NtrC family response regulator
MPASAARSPQFRYSVAVVTSDKGVWPEAESYLASECELHLLPGWEELIGLMKKRPLDAVLLDLDTVGERSEDGIEAARELRILGPELVLVGLTRSGSHNLRLKAVGASVDEYFVAPVDFGEVRLVLHRTLEKRALEIEHRQRQRQRGQQGSFGNLIGASEPMQRVYAAIARVAHSVTTVLVRGESGTGKELVARAVVGEGPRRDKPFVSINCAALPENLIETELFGHEKGAFTDARATRVGHIELAHTGTLFLDEIATLGLGLQSKLLRVLEERAVTRIGGKTPKSIDFRLITATNDNLEELVAAQFDHRPEMIKGLRQTTRCHSARIRIGICEALRRVPSPFGTDSILLDIVVAKQNTPWSVCAMFPAIVHAQCTRCAKVNVTPSNSACAPFAEAFEVSAARRS